MEKFKTPIQVKAKLSKIGKGMNHIVVKGETYTAVGRKKKAYKSYLILLWDKEELVEFEEKYFNKISEVY